LCSLISMVSQNSVRIRAFPKFFLRRRSHTPSNNFAGCFWNMRSFFTIIALLLALVSCAVAQEPDALKLLDDLSPCAVGIPKHFTHGGD
jgi:hypothetical protein